MIGYVTLGTNDIDRAAAFYDALFAEVGANRLMEMGRLISWGVGFDKPMLAVTQPYDGNAASAGNGTMVALVVSSTADVDRLHAKAMELGGTDEGAPGARGPGFYGGYFRDLDGNKLVFFCTAGGG